MGTRLLVRIILFAFLQNFATLKLVDSVSIVPKVDIEWTHHASLPGGFEVKWISTEEQFITIQMSAPTKGYLGVGFSPSGGMPGSDIVIGWVDDDGTPHLKDYYGTKNGAPTEDPTQDYELLDAKEDEFGTNIIFRRKWDTCDEKHDRMLGDDTVKLIWAWHAEDPKEDGLQWHGPGIQRGARSVYLKVLGKPKSFPDDPEKPNPDVQHWDITMENFLVPNVSTYYYCKIFQFPKLEKKNHIIGYKPLIISERTPYIHHINVYRCLVPKQFGNADNKFKKYVGAPGQDCVGADTPKDWSEFCFTFLLAHGIGAEGDIFPDHIGAEIGEHDEATYLRLEVHYENPENLHMVDSSGLRIYYTPKLREYDLAMMFVGHRRTPFLSIPPHQKSFTTSGHCPSECTEIGLPKTGVKLFSVLLHAHLAGRGLKLRHIRNGMELPVIAQDHSYDFSYQEYRILAEEVLLLPGDELVMECEYNTESHDEFILGGLSSKYEMCEAFIYYYPKSNLVDCRSQPELHSYLEAVGITHIKGDLLKKLTLPYDPTTLPEKMQDFALADDSFVMNAVDPNATLAELFNTLEINVDTQKPNHLVSYLNSLDWKNEKLSRLAEQTWGLGPRYAHCAAPEGKRIKQKHHVLPISKFEPLPSEESGRHKKCLAG